MEENDNQDGYYLRIDERILSTEEYLNLYAEVSEKRNMTNWQRIRACEAGQSISSYSDIEKWIAS